MSSKDEKLNERKRGAIIGAAVADAASLGFHWLYDQDRIKSLATSAPEFRQPDVADYADTSGYFAHANKNVGDFSQYGEQHLTMLRSLSGRNGIYDKAEYESAFVEHFGYGGSYSGYIDHPTRDTLNNIVITENSALERATSIPFTGSDELKRKLVTKVLGNAKQFSGDALKRKVEDAVRLTDNNDNLVKHALNMLKEWESVQGYHGANDTQLPALSKLPALICAYTEKNDLLAVVESAVRVTNNNDKAVAFSQVSAKILEAAIATGDHKSAIDAAKKDAPDVVAPLIEQALSSLSRSTPDVTGEWGMACQLSIGFPSAVHSIAKSSSFTEAIRQNIYAGGDSCGRSILIGAVMGACYGIGSDNGVPEQWVSRLSQLSDLQQHTTNLIDKLS